MVLIALLKCLISENSRGVTTFLKESELGSENVYPLELVFCKQCELLQLNHTIPKEMMFSNHQYLSSMTTTLEDHFFDIAEENKTCFDLQERRPYH